MEFVLLFKLCFVGCELALLVLCEVASQCALD